MKYVEQVARAGAVEGLVQQAGDMLISGADFLAIECLKGAVKQAKAYVDEYIESGEGYPETYRRMLEIASHYAKRIERLEAEYSIRDAREQVRG